MNNIAIAPALLLAAASAAADYPQPAVPPGWDCKMCPTEEGITGNAEAGVGYVSQDSFKFGDYTGLNEKGPYAVVDGDARYRGTNGSYMDARGTNLGLDSRELGASGGRQGSYGLFINYDEIPKLTTDTARTPFLGVGGDRLTLPSDWVPGATTGAMPRLPDSLRQVDIDTKRKRLDGGFSYDLLPHWEFTARFTHDTKDGTHILGAPIGGTFATSRASILPAPVDYETNQVDVAISYNGERLQGELGYYGSFFSDGNKSVTWQNPFADPTSPTGQGAMGLPPDNHFNQVFASLGYDLAEHTRATGYFSYGKMSQDDAFLAATINPTLNVTLPRSSLDGDVDVTSAKLSVASRPMTKLGLNLDYQFNERANHTDSATYQYVLDDARLATNPRTNLPYSFRQNLVKLSADYRFDRRTTLAGGFDYDRYRRTNQQRDRTDDKTVWAKLSLIPHEAVDVAFNYAFASRGGSAFHEVAEITPPENPLMQKYYLADRKRNKGGVLVTLTPIDKISLGLGVDLAFDNYTDSPIGLTEDRDNSYTVDLAATPRDNLTLHLYYNRDEVRSKQANSMAFSTPNWVAENDDTISTVGLGFRLRQIVNKLDIGGDYTFAYSRGETSVSTEVFPVAPFPNLTTKLQSVSLYGTYQLTPDLSLRTRYLYENFNSTDWALDGVAPDTIPEVLSLGQTSPDYHVNVLAVSLRYTFK